MPNINSANHEKPILDVENYAQCLARRMNTSEILAYFKLKAAQRSAFFKANREAIIARCAEIKVELYGEKRRRPDWVDPTLEQTERGRRDAKRRLIAKEVTELWKAMLARDVSFLEVQEAAAEGDVVAIMAVSAIQQAAEGNMKGLELFQNRTEGAVSQKVVLDVSNEAMFTAVGTALGEICPRYAEDVLLRVRALLDAGSGS